MIMGILLAEILMLTDHSICTAVFPAPLQVGGDEWLALHNAVYGFSVPSSSIVTCIEVKLPQEWNEAAWIHELVLSDQEINICHVNPEFSGGWNGAQLCRLSYLLEKADEEHTTDVQGINVSFQIRMDCLLTEEGHVT